jgi:hypothetical protein
MRSFLVGFLLLIAAAVLFGQSTQSGTVRGTVTDPSAAIVAGAKVTISNETKLVSRTMQSTSDGDYLFQQLPPGRYDLSVESAGFALYMQKGIVLHSGDNLRANVGLKPTAVATTVEVVAEAAPALNTVNASIDYIVASQELQNILLPANDAIRAAALIPGARDEYTHNGQASSQSVIVVDGSNDGDETSGSGTWKFNPPADTVSEFRVTQNAYTADLGRASAARLELVTKSGNNQFHGTAYWFHRNQNFNAKTWGSTSKSLRKYNEIGYNVGGPIKKERIYFFWTNYYRRNTTPYAAYRTWPTVAQAGGDFSAWLNPGSGLKARTIKDPVTGQPFSGNLIPTTRLNSNATGYLNLFYPLVSNAYALANNGYTSAPRYDNDNYFAPRVDFRITDKLNMYVRATKDKRAQDYEYLATPEKPHPDPLSVPGWLYSGSIAGTYVASPRFLVDFQTTFSHTDGSWKMLEPTSALLSRIPGWSSKLLYPAGNVLQQLPQLNISGNGYTNIGRATGRFNKWAQGNGGANFSYQAARHSVKFGFDEVYRTQIQTGMSNTFGTFNFDSSATGDALADFLLGSARSFSQNSTPTYWRGRAWQHAVYGQDEIKLSKKLTLTAGVRWEADGAYKSVEGQKWANWRPEKWSLSSANRVDPATGIIIGDANYLNGIEVVDVVGPAPKKNFAPRVAIAYAPGNGKTSIRAGYGIFFDHQAGSTSRLPGNPPFRYSATLNYIGLNDPTGGQPDALRPTTLSAILMPFQTPQTQKYSGGVQREFAGMLAEVSYVGWRSTHQVISTNLNQPAPNASIYNKTVNIDAARPYYGFGAITMTTFSGSGRYNSLQMQLRRPMKKGLFLQASYTLQKQTLDGGGMDPQNRAYEAGEVAGQGHHIMSMTGAYKPEFFTGANPFVKLLLNGWTMSSTGRWLSGGPLSGGVMMTTDTTGTGRAFRADWAGSVNQPHTWDLWFDPSAFSASPALKIGNSPVDAIWGPGSWTFDAGVFRDFKLHEKVAMQYRFESYNTMNHFNLNNPVTTFAQANFGKVTSKGGSPRNLQMALRFTF